MKSTVLLSLLSLASSATVGKYEVNPAFKYPWMVSLQYFDQHISGGILVNGNSIITSAHIVQGNDGYWFASIHRHNLTSNIKDENGIKYNVIKRIIHPKYDPNTLANDVSIWKINAPTNSNAILYDDGTSSNIDNKLLKVIGWGPITSPDNKSAVLQEIELPVLNFNQCKMIYPNLDLNSHLCTQYIQNGVDFCEGYTGGPLFSTCNNKVVLVGVISQAKACRNKGFPNTYTRVAGVVDFIKQNV